MAPNNKYEIVQHTLAGSTTHHLAVLEIINPPPEHWPIVLCFIEFKKGSEPPYYIYIEWKTIKDAKKGFDLWAPILRSGKECSLNNMPGYKRTVDCKNNIPWFYEKNSGV